MEHNPHKERIINVSHSTSTAHRLYQYNGACSNIHGHNLTWEGALTVDVDVDDESQMPVDFKEVKEMIDVVDHATVVNKSDPVAEHESLLGEIVTVTNDPTCENLVDWMALRLYNLATEIKQVELKLTETDSYSVETTMKYEPVRNFSQ